MNLKRIAVVIVLNLAAAAIMLCQGQKPTPPQPNGSVCPNGKTYVCKVVCTGPGKQNCQTVCKCQ